VRCACIDIGSNTTRLLVAEPDRTRPGRLRVVGEQRIFLKLRADGVADAQRRRLEHVLRAQVRMARDAGAERLRVVGTAALRGTAGLDLDLSAAAEVHVEVLSGAEEARLAFLGATAVLPDAGTTVAVVDVGGGSTEVASGRPGEDPTWWASMAVGSGVLTDAHLHSDPPSEDELAAARAAAQTAVDAAGCPGADAAWAVGGSATTLRRFVGEELSAAALDRALRALAGAPAAETAERLALHPERARLLPAGLLVLATLAGALGCPLHVGGGGLREGVVLDLLAQEPDMG
jgi:exopolyphosphatase/guanosine-5'-triphosphate,3'-diphosphate pyrophosphatase